jgi:hypothetical protein
MHGLSIVSDDANGVQVIEGALISRAASICVESKVNMSESATGYQGTRSDGTLPLRIGSAGLRHPTPLEVLIATPHHS